MEIEFSLNREDVLAFWKAAVARRSRQKRRRASTGGGWVGLGFIALFLALSAWHWLTDPKFSFWDNWSVTIPALILIVALLLAGLGLMLQIWAKRRWLTPANLEHYCRQRRWSISADGMVLATADTTVTFRWSAIQEIEVTPARAFFYVGPAEAQVLPRRAFVDDEAFEVFVEQAELYRESAGAVDRTTGERSPPGPVVRSEQIQTRPAPRVIGKKSLQSFREETGNPGLWERVPLSRRDLEPHRGCQLFWLSRLSLFLAILSFLAIPIVAALPVSIITWVMATEDLQRMRDHAMDPEGWEQTTGARRAVLTAWVVIALAAGFYILLLLTW